MKNTQPSKSSRPECHGKSCECDSVPRRTFLLTTSATTASLLTGMGSVRRTYANQVDGVDHFVPENKELTQDWLNLLTTKGERKVYRGDELRTIGMPCGGIAAGQLYVLGDGSLGYWWIANNAYHTGYGGRTEVETTLGKFKTCYVTFEPPRPIDQGFAIKSTPHGGESVTTPLNKHGYSEIGFIGEYPIAEITYERTSGTPQPVSVKAEVFSPFIPQDTKNSSLPMTVLRYTVTNKQQVPVDVELAGWLENPVLAFERNERKADSRTLAVQLGEFGGLHMRASPSHPGLKSERASIHFFEDFEHGYDAWDVSGDAFGKTPAQGTLPNQNPVDGFEGDALVNTYLHGDTTTGVATSKAFTIDHPFIAMLIGGGQHPEVTCVNLLIDGKVVRSVTGKNTEKLDWHCWDVCDLKGKQARIEIIDQARGHWGHINVDQIVFADQPIPIPSEFDSRWPELGDVSLLRIDGPARAATGFDSGQAFLEALEKGDAVANRPLATRRPVQEKSVGATLASATLHPGESHTFTYVLSWYFPNRIQDDADSAQPGERVGVSGPIVGNMYANWFASSSDVTRYFKANQDYLESTTRLFRDTLYDTSLPYWLVHRLSMPLANLATELVQWRRDGRFWAWEGTGCCPGCCGHVWNYAQAIARLFPEWERSMRSEQDFNPKRGFDENTGLILFRGVGKIGEGWTGGWAADAQGGYVLKAYREHLCSANDAFLREHWPLVKRAVEALTGEDGKDARVDGFLEDRQHNTYDIDYYGANTLVGAMYHGALRAAAKMADCMGDAVFARRCTQLADQGAESTMNRIWREDWGYFVQDVDLAKHPRNQQGDGCLADQHLGQSLAHQCGLGHLYPEDAVRKTMSSIWNFNWAPDINPQNDMHPPGRWFCRPGEAGLFMCTWPKTKHLGPASVRYRNEVWTGTEYQVAAHMFYEGMTIEPLAIIRAIHERYDGVKHNPWNEIECGDHYARALASWGCLLGISGFEYDGPAGHIGFSPKLQPESFKCFFSAAEGWGSYQQQLEHGTHTATLSLKWGKLRVKSIALSSDRPASIVRVDGKQVDFEQQGDRINVKLTADTTLTNKQMMTIEVS